MSTSTNTGDLVIDGDEKVVAFPGGGPASKPETSDDLADNAKAVSKNMQNINASAKRLLIDSLTDVYFAMIKVGGHDWAAKEAICLIKAGDTLYGKTSE